MPTTSSGAHSSESEGHCISASFVVVASSDPLAAIPLYARYDGWLQLPFVYTVVQSPMLIMMQLPLKFYRELPGLQQSRLRAIGGTHPAFLAYLQPADVIRPVQPMQSGSAMLSAWGQARTSSVLLVTPPVGIEWRSANVVADTLSRDFLSSGALTLASEGSKITDELQGGKEGEPANGPTCSAPVEQHFTKQTRG